MAHLYWQSEGNLPKPAPRSKFDDAAGGGELGFNLPDLPNVPSPGTNSTANKDSPDDIDFDDLNKRFQNLKKKWFH